MGSAEWGAGSGERSRSVSVSVSGETGALRGRTERAALRRGRLWGSAALPEHGAARREGDPSAALSSSARGEGGEGRRAESECAGTFELQDGVDVGGDRAVGGKLELRETEGTVGGR